MAAPLGGQAIAEDDYPNKPLTFVVSFGVGGSSDRMTRATVPYIAAELGQPIQVINKPGAGTLLGANYTLRRPDDGYTVLASAFSPYLSNTILEGNADYAIEDFAYLNLQWVDEDILGISRRSKYKNLLDLLEAVRSKPKTVRAAVVRGSTGHLMARKLMEVNGIPQENLNLVAYNDGARPRAAVAGGVVDFIVISAKVTEAIKDYIIPAAIVSDRPNAFWGAPTLNGALAPLGVQAPLMPSSVRGFATSKAFQEKHPERFAKLVGAMERAMKSEELQESLRKSGIGARWIGPEASAATMRSSFEIFKNYSYLLEIK